MLYYAGKFHRIFPEMSSFDLLDMSSNSSFCPFSAVQVKIHVYGAQVCNIKRDFLTSLNHVDDWVPTSMPHSQFIKDIRVLIRKISYYQSRLKHSLDDLQRYTAWHRYLISSHHVVPKRFQCSPKYMLENKVRSLTLRTSINSDGRNDETA